MFEYTGIVNGKRIDLDASVPLPEGTRVRVSVAPESAPRKGSPDAVLRLAGTLSDEEADAILAAAQRCRRVDEALWKVGQ
jgi:hypothetical protein